MPVGEARAQGGEEERPPGATGAAGRPVPPAGAWLQLVGPQELLSSQIWKPGDQMGVSARGHLGAEDGCNQPRADLARVFTALPQGPFGGPVARTAMLLGRKCVCFISLEVLFLFESKSLAVLHHKPKQTTLRHERMFSVEAGPVRGCTGLSGPEAGGAGLGLGLGESAGRGRPSSLLACILDTKPCTVLGVCGDSGRGKPRFRSCLYVNHFLSLVCLNKPLSNQLSAEPLLVSCCAP